MVFAFGCPKVLGLNSSAQIRKGSQHGAGGGGAAAGEMVVDLCFAPSASVLAVATTQRLRVWSGGGSQIELGSLPVPLSSLPSGRSLVWSKDASAVAAITIAKTLVLCSVVRDDSRGAAALEAIPVPDWLNQSAPLDATEADPWANAEGADVALITEVSAVPAAVTAVCAGRFRARVLVGTADGQIYSVSWDGAVEQRYAMVLAWGASPLIGSLPGAQRSPIAGAITSMSFSDQLQLLAITASDGRFALCGLGAGTCTVRYISVEPAQIPRSLSRAPTFPSHHPGAAAAATNTGLAAPAGATATGAAAASALKSRSASPLPPPLIINNSKDMRSNSNARGGARTHSALFAERGNLLAVAVTDGTVLVARVDHFVRGARATHDFLVSDMVPAGTPRAYRMMAPPEGELAGAEAAAATAAAATHRERAFQQWPQAPGASFDAAADSSAANAAAGADNMPFPPIRRKNSMSALTGVELRLAHCLSLAPWLASAGDCRGVTARTGPVRSLCFSGDGSALAVGHERAVTLWSTESGARLMCTLSDESSSEEVEKEGGAAAGERSAHGGSDGSSSNAAATADGGSSRADFSGSSGSVLRKGKASGASSRTGWVDGICGLAWGCRGYRLLAAMGRNATQGGAGNSEPKESRVMAWELFRIADSAVSPALTCLQGADRVANLAAQPWNPHTMAWEVIPCHPAYIGANAPLRHVATSRSGSYLAAAGAFGFSVYSCAARKWRVFGHAAQERDVRVAGMCWWGDSAIAVVSRAFGGSGSHAFDLLLYPRTHLDTSSLLHAPVRLPLGLKPAFICGGGAESSTGSLGLEVETFLLLVAGRASYAVYRFSCEGALLGNGVVTCSTLFEGSLPHVREAEKTAAASAASAVSIVSGAAAEGAAAVPTNDPRSEGLSVDAALPVRLETNGTVPQAAGTGERRLSWGDGGSSVGGEEAAAAGSARETATAASSVGLLGLGPPKQILLLPSVHPRSIAVLDHEGHLATLELESGAIRAVAADVASVLDLTALSEVWDLAGRQTGVHPCYLLCKRTNESNSPEGEEFAPQGTRVDLESMLTAGGSANANAGPVGQAGFDYELWCPAMALNPKPSPAAELLGWDPSRALSSSSRRSPALVLDPNSQHVADTFYLGLDLRLGTIVHGSQVISRVQLPSFALPPCYELRTHLRPVLHLVLRHLLLQRRLQLLEASERSSTHAQIAQTAQQSVGTRMDSAMRSPRPVLQTSLQYPSVAGSAQTTFDQQGSPTPPGDALEIAILLLERCKTEPSLSQALSDTLELLLHACICAVTASQSAAAAGAIGGGSSSGGSAARRVRLAELKIARGVLEDALSLAQRAHACFYEAVVRAARKIEPEHHSVVFPFRLERFYAAGSSLEENTMKFGVRSSGSEPVMAYPTHIFHECLAERRLAAAAWCLPLVQEPEPAMAWGGVVSSVMNTAPMPEAMLALVNTTSGWQHGLAHALACRLLQECLERQAHRLLPQVWLFARKLEGEDAAGAGDRPAELQSSDGRKAPGSRDAGAATTIATQAFSDEPSPAETAADLNSGTEAAASAGESQASLLGRLGAWWWGGSVANGGMNDSSDAAETLLGDDGTSLHHQTLEQCAAAAQAPSGDGEGGSSTLAALQSLAHGARSEAGADGNGRLEGGPRYDATPARDAPAVLSLFLWRKLSEGRADAALRALKALTTSPAAQEAGLDAAQVLPLLKAPTTQRTTQGHQPEETMLQLTRSCADALGTPLAALASALAEPRDANTPGNAVAALELLQGAAAVVNHAESALVFALLLRDAPAFTATARHLEAEKPGVCSRYIDRLAAGDAGAYSAALRSVVEFAMPLLLLAGRP